MSKKVPHRSKYQLANKFNKALNCILIASSLISALIIGFNVFPSYSSVELIGASSKALAFLSVVYFLLEIFKSETFQKAEFARKNDFIDNSLNTNLSQEKSKGYFSNEEVDIGILKLGVNCFENSFFTKSITQKMLNIQYIYLTIVLITILSFVIFLDNPIIVEVLLLALPYSIALETYKLYRLQQNTNLVLNNFKRIFSSTKKSKRLPLIIDNIISYEKALSSGGILLNSNIFSKMNKDLSYDWEELKTQLEIS